MIKQTYISKLPNKQGIVDFSQEDNAVWSTLINRQNKIVPNRACDGYLQGLQTIQFSPDTIPQYPDLNEILRLHFGWQVEPVTSVISAGDFFCLLAQKKFPVATFIRRPEDLDYIEEPDIFHEYYGHLPVLNIPECAEFMFEYAKMVLCLDKSYYRHCFRLFWFTIEFGLLHTDLGLRIYGAGILSSFQEAQSCLDMAQSIHRSFNVLEVLRTRYSIDKIQPTYFIINNFNELTNMLKSNLLYLIEEAKILGDINLFDPSIIK